MLKNRKHVGLRLTLGLVFSLSFSAEAGTFRMFGLGAQNLGMAGATMTVPTDAYSMQYNPALMSLQPGTLFSFGLVGAVTRFEKINNIVVDTPTLGGSGNAPIYGNVDTSTTDTFTSTFGFKFQLSKNERPLHFGMNISMPFENLMSIETEDSFVPQYSMYLADTQRLELAFHLGWKWSEKFSMGVGANTYLVQGANARMRMPAGGNSTGKIKMDVKRGLAPVVGTLWRPTEHISAALTYFAKQDNRSDFRFENTIGVLSPAVLNLTAQSSLYFDPETYGGGVSYRDDKDTYALSTLYERWSAFSGSQMRLNFESFLNSFSQTLPNSTFHDIWRVQAGYEHRWDSWAWRGGYSYFPSPVPEPVGDLNFLDSDRHTMHLGIGKKWEKPFDFLDGNFRLDIAGFVQYLTAKNIVKTNPNNVGYPGYKVGGWVYGYGLTATSEL